MAQWQLLDPTATDTYAQLGLGGALNHDTHLWQLWLSLDGYHINWICAHREQARVDAAIQTIKQEIATWREFDLEKLRALLDRLYAESEQPPQEMPEENRAIRRNLRGTGTWQ